MSDCLEKATQYKKLPGCCHIPYAWLARAGSPVTQATARDALGAGWVQTAGLEINPRGFAGYRKTTHTALKTARFRIVCTAKSAFYNTIPNIVRFIFYIVQIICIKSNLL
jgi:hypothetical protein